MHEFFSPCMHTLYQQEDGFLLWFLCSGTWKKNAISQGLLTMTMILKPNCSFVGMFTLGVQRVLRQTCMECTPCVGNVTDSLLWQQMTTCTVGETGGYNVVGTWGLLEHWVFLFQLIMILQKNTICIKVLFNNTHGSFHEVGAKYVTLAWTFQCK